METEMSLKERIRSGKIVVGVSASLDTDRSTLEKILSKDTYSFITIDSQHSPYNEEKLVSFCRMSEGLGFPVPDSYTHLTLPTIYSL